MSTGDDFLFVEKYRPKTIEDCILPKQLKETFQGLTRKRKLLNLMLCGQSGIGKTTVAKALCNEIKADTLIINASLDRNIDTLRNEIQNFASSKSFTGKRKYVILDEFDNSNPNSTQFALRNFIEKYHKNCGFILTCNYPTNIIEALHSRCSKIDFVISNDEKLDIMRQFYKRLVGILKKEEIQFDKKVVASLVEKMFPDFRKILNEIQKYSVNGVIDAGILTSTQNVNLDELIKHLKEKHWNNMRDWVSKYSINYNNFYSEVYNTLTKLIQDSSKPQLVAIINEYMCKEPWSMDKEITRTACLTDIMRDIEWKG